nr:MAG: Terminase [Bacteriophage sp.]
MIRFSDKQRRLATWWSGASSGYDGVIAEGAVRSGKTWAMVTGFILWSQSRFSHRNFIVAGRTIGSLTRNVVMPMLTILGQEMGFPFEYNRGNGFVRVGTNTYWLFGASSEQAQDVIQGMTAAGCLLDEVALMPRSFVDQALARCSVDGAKFWWNCNPSYPTHYVKRDFIDRARERHLLVMKFGMSDNPTLSESVRQRYERMYSGVFYDRFIRGLWVVAEGLVYQDFREDTMCAELPAEDVRRSPHVLSIDYGITNPFVAIDWVVKAGVAYAVDEYCFDSRAEGHRRTDEEHYGALRKWMGERYVELVVIDPSASSFMECIARHGEWDYRGADNAVIEGISNTMTAMRQHGLFIGRKCGRLLSELGLYRWDERRRHEEVVKEDDHACLVGSTMVETDGGAVRIDGLVGTSGRVWSYDGGEAVLRGYRDVAPTGFRETYEVVLGDGRTVECTGNHPFLTDSGWRRCDGLARGDRIVDVSPRTGAAGGVSAVGVARVGRTGEVRPVYNMTVDGTHNFAVNGGLVTHNCDAMRYFVQTVGLRELSCFEWD